MHAAPTLLLLNFPFVNEILERSLCHFVSLEFGPKRDIKTLEIGETPIPLIQLCWRRSLRNYCLSAKACMKILQANQVKADPLRCKILKACAVSW